MSRSSILSDKALEGTPREIPAVSPVAFALALILSLVLLLGVGLAEAFRVYPEIERERLRSQGEIVQGPLERFLQADLPLDQFPGFQSVVAPLLDSDPSLRRFEVVNLAGVPVFSMEASRSGREERLDTISLPLRSRFEQLGELKVSMDWSVTVSRVRRVFLRLFLAASIMVLIGTIAVSRTRGWKRSELLVKLIFTMTFIAMSALVVSSLVTVYKGGIQGKDVALAESLSSRLRAPLDLGLNPEEDLEGIGRILNEYRALNPEIRRLQLRGESGTIYSSGAAIDNPQLRIREDYVFPMSVGTVKEFGYSIELEISVPKRVVYSKLWKSAKNFLALFGGVFLLAQLFLSFLLTFKASSTNTNEQSKAKRRLELVKPFHTMTVLMEGLCVSFLPFYLQSLLERGQRGSGDLSSLFLVYFASFAFTLMPAGRFAQRHGPRKLLLMSMVFAAAGLGGLAVFESAFALALMRMLSGIGQGMSLVAVQSYILQTSAPFPKLTSMGTSFIVLGYQTGMIAGNALGALLVVYTSPQVVFLSAALLGLMNAMFAIIVLYERCPQSSPLSYQSSDSPDRARIDGTSFVASLWKVLTDREVISTVFLIGVPTKALLAGIVIFAMPLILNTMGYGADDIGQILMFYAGGVLASNLWGGRRARSKNLTGLLMLGSCGGGLGLLLIGSGGLNWASILPALSWIESGLLIVGISLLGLSHGLIHGPVLAFVASSGLSRSLGATTLSSTYRFLERLGTLIGPVVVAFFLTTNDYSLISIAQIGFGVILLGLLFGLIQKRTNSPEELS